MTTSHNIDKGRASADGHVKPPFDSGIDIATAALEETPLGKAAVSEGKAALKGLRAGSRAWAGWAHDVYQVNTRAYLALIGCRSMQAVVSVQGNLMQEHLKLLVDNSRRMTTVGWKTALQEHEAAHVH